MDRLYVSADIEGVCGIVDWKETEIGEAQGAYFRAEMTSEVAAACEAAVASGVTDILVKDAHGSGRSIDPSRLPREARVLRAWTRDPYVMMAGLEPSHEGVFFIGYHSAAGTAGSPLAHTMDTNNVAVRINGELASEFLINAYIAAHVGVPVLLLAGDAALCATAASVNPNIHRSRIRGPRQRVDIDTPGSGPEAHRGRGGRRARGRPAAHARRATRVLRRVDTLQAALAGQPGLVLSGRQAPRRPRGRLLVQGLGRGDGLPVLRAMTRARRRAKAPSALALAPRPWYSFLADRRERGA